LKNKYVIFKDDDVGKDLYKLKKFINVIIDNEAKAAIGLIGKYLKNQSLVKYLNFLDANKIEIFCHGYYHNYMPFLLNKIFKKKILSVEFDKNLKNHNKSLKKYRILEARYLKSKSIAFGPPGNIYNDSVIDVLLNYDFKLMFSWRKLNVDIITIPISNNFNQISLDNFIRDYKKNKKDIIFTLQFHHSRLNEKHLITLKEIINYLKKEEKRKFILPTDLYKLYIKNKIYIN
jgi:peptidoglycan/xylan/chitin deacetylase (PgdA/CDA1 family)